MVMLELTYLFELKRIKDSAVTIARELEATIGVEISEPNFHFLIRSAIQIKWTRDPFDRIITAEAALHDAPLVSADRVIRKHYVKTIW